MKSQQNETKKSRALEQNITKLMRKGQTFEMSDA
jgi:hypothetical protein